MAQKTLRSLPTAHSDLRTDYAMIAMAIGGALLALVYLVLI
jgi:hypothetical protein